MLILLIIGTDIFAVNISSKEGELLFTQRASCWMQATTSLLMWLRTFYFLRIKKQTSFYVHMIMQIFRKSVYFFAMFVLILISFGCTFAVLGMSPQNRKFFAGLNYAYQLALGEFNLPEDS